MQGKHNGKMADLFNWPKFRLTKLVFFKARAVNRGTHVYPRMSKGYLQPLVGMSFIKPSSEILMFSISVSTSQSCWNTANEV